MVAVDRTLEGDVLCIRPSQEKFNAPDPLYLEIVKTVKTSSPGYLNRQLILLLSTLGVSDDVFIPLQNQMRDDINSIMTNENKALEICKCNMGTRDTSHIKSTIISMIKAVCIFLLSSTCFIKLFIYISIFSFKKKNFSENDARKH